MIDEELYQRATDELNSDRRRAHLWARACALSNDDHDEARYLYTNLRVEELIAERERGGPGPDAIALDEASGPLELEPLATSGPAPAAADPFASYEPEERPDERLDDTEPDTELAQAVAASHEDGFALVPEPSGTDAMRADATDVDPTEAHPAGTGTDDAAADASAGAGLELPAPVAADAPAGAEGVRPQSVRGAVRLELADENFDLDADEIGRLNDAEPPRDSSSARVALAANADLASTGADDLDATQRVHVGGRPHAQQAHVPPTLRKATAVRPVPAPGARRTELHDADEQLDEIIDGGERGRDGVEGSARRASDARVRSDYADVHDLDSLLEGGPGSTIAGAGAGDSDGTLDIVEDDTGRGRRWSVYEDGDGSLQAVKRGVCWPALVITLPWLLVRGLVGTAVVYALLAVASLGGAALTGAAWLDAGPAVDGATVLAFSGFAAIAAVGLLLVPWLRANRWRAGRLVRQGWELAGELRARSADSAIERFRELDSGTP